MKRRLRRLSGRVAVVLSTALAAVLAAPPAAAQDTTATMKITTVDTSKYPTVTLTVTAPATLGGDRVAGDAFTLTENGQALDIEVTYLGNDQLQVVLVVDTSGSMRGDPLAAAKSAGASFVAQMPPGTRFGVVGFGARPAVASPLSPDRDATVAALQNLDADGTTALYDALLLGLGQFAPDGGRRALVVLSDGGDTASQATLESAQAALAGSGVELAVVELVTPDYDAAALATLATAAGGHVVAAGDPSQLTAVFAGVASDLLNRYALTYESQSGGATGVAIEVRTGELVAGVERTVRLPGRPPATARPAPEPTRVAQPGWMGSRPALFVGLGVLIAGLSALFGSMFLSRRDVRVSPQLGGGGFELRRRAGISHLADRASNFAEHVLARRNRASRVNLALERAGLNLRPGEFAVLAATAAVAALAVGMLVSGPVAGLTLAALTVPAARRTLGFLADRRRRAFGDQLADTLQLLSGSLRAGHGILQAMDSVAADAPEPTRSEFGRLVVEVRLGRDYGESLHAMRERLGNDDFMWFVQAVEIHREVGGDLAQILDTVAETIRDRTRLQRHVQALSAEGRLSGMILFALPIVVALLVSVLNPGYFSELFRSASGLGMLATAVGLMTVGALWLRRIVRPVF